MRREGEKEREREREEESFSGSVKSFLRRDVRERNPRGIVLDARRLPIHRSISIIIVLTSSLSFCLPLVSGLRISNKEGIEGRIRSRVEDYWLCRVLFDEEKSICTCRRRG